MNSLLASGPIGFRRCQFVDRNRGSNRDLEELPDKRRLIETLLLGYPPEAGLSFCGNSTGDERVSGHSAIVD